MQFLSHIYLQLHWFGCDIHHQLKDYIILMKILRLTIFQNRNAHTGSLFKNRNILELSAKLVRENCIIISKSLHKTLPKILCDWFILSFESHSYSISWARYSVNTNAIYIWDFLHSQHQGTLFYILRTKKCRGLITSYLLKLVSAILTLKF